VLPNLYPVRERLLLLWVRDEKNVHSLLRVGLDSYLSNGVYQAGFKMFYSQHAILPKVTSVIHLERQ
jgi:hypothetical protein